MRDLNREPIEAEKIIDKKRATWVARDEDEDEDETEEPHRSASKRSTDIYDALDYRLMATFPASDAVAQY